MKLNGIKLMRMTSNSELRSLLIRITSSPRRNLARRVKFTRGRLHERLHSI